MHVLVISFCVRGRWSSFVRLAVWAGVVLAPALLRSQEVSLEIAPVLRRYCADCHTGKEAEGRIDLTRMLAKPSLADSFKEWRQVVEKLRRGEMPPPDAPQPDAAQRRQLVATVEHELDRVVRQHAADPGEVVMRRLTSAEHAYTIRDLTGLELEFPAGSDAVGGAGFTNVGFVQFVQESTLERYLEVAKLVADHAVVGAGRLQFFKDPGKTGFELAAIHRIQEIYKNHGFRTSAGEGGEAFGLDFYPRAFYVAWRYLHRERLGLEGGSIGQLAAEEQLSRRFTEHIWSVLSQPSPSFPTSEIVARWRELPVPLLGEPVDAIGVRAECNEIYTLLQSWYRRLATANDDEAAPVVVEDSVNPTSTQTLKVRIIWPEGAEVADVRWEVVSADRGPDEGTAIVWSNPRIRFLNLDRRWQPEQPLRDVVPGEVAQQLAFGKHPRGTAVASTDFVTEGGAPRSFSLGLPENGRSAELTVEARVDPVFGKDRVVRGGISAGELAARGKTISALLTDRNGSGFEVWNDGVLEFARNLPQVSHREPAPSDRDPIPAPFDNTYNMPERDHFHYRVKYFRDDGFLTEKLLDDPTRRRLEEAWADLLTSFEYHDVFLRFVADKFDFPWRPVSQVDKPWIAQLPAPARPHVQRLHAEWAAARQLVENSRERHFADVMQFASRAWRRPLTAEDQERLRRFYDTVARDGELDYSAAIRALLARVLVAPEFIYRAERPASESAAVPLTSWELASRLSYLFWSSLPDAELRRAADEGELVDPSELVRQARRMLRDPKSRRFATEFFGQWFGFYRFDQFRGVDSERFPEFTEQLRAAMYDEAVEFFAHLVREDRPVGEILFADYAFWNRSLSEHYGAAVSLAAGQLQRVDGVKQFQRGGLIGLGAVLTVTSAPLRTSPVKRGDWILRRVIGTPVPPPPADAGSIPADDRVADGLTIRQRLEAHRQQASCVNCHVRIDPLGFALEHYDAIGRWRKVYRGGKPIDASGVLKDGNKIVGPDGLRHYLEMNEVLFQQTLCSKLVGYALGRGASVADQQLIETMLESLEEDDKFSMLVEKIVTSTQFRYHRGSK